MDRHYQNAVFFYTLSHCSSVQRMNRISTFKSNGASVRLPLSYASTLIWRGTPYKSLQRMINQKNKPQKETKPFNLWGQKPEDLQNMHIPVGNKNKPLLYLELVMTDDRRHIKAHHWINSCMQEHFSERAGSLQLSLQTQTLFSGFENRFFFSSPSNMTVWK